MGKKTIQRGNGTGCIYKQIDKDKQTGKARKRRKPYRVVVTLGIEKYLDGERIIDISKLTDDELLRVKTKQKRKTIGLYHTKQEAEKALSDYFMAPETANEMTVADMYDKWSEAYFEDKSQSIVYERKRSYKRIEPLHKRKLKDLHTPELESFIYHLECTDNEKNSVRLLLTLMYDEAIRLGIVQTNYARNVRKVKVTPKKETRPFTDDEIELLEQSEEPIAKLLLCLIYSGFRINEMLNIKVVDWDGIKCFEGGSKTKAGKDRKVPIHSKLEGIYEDVVSKYVGREYTGVKKNFNTFKEKNGLNHVFHDTRATFSTKCDEYRVDPIVAKHLLGHSVDDITEKFYTRRSAKRFKEQIELIQ